MLAVGDSEIEIIRVGDRVPTKAFKGDDLVWELPPVIMTIEGTSFSPQLELAAGSTATITWTDQAGNVLASGLEPNITWADAGPHTVRIYVSAPEDIVTFNIGFHEQQDSGLYSLPSTYRRATQPVTSINNLQYFTGLRRFMAARTDGVSPDYTTYNGPLLSGHLNLTGMTTLEYIECFRANIQTVAMIGCSSVIRLCLEGCQLTEVDINPMRQSLLDFRIAAQQGGSLELKSLDGPLESLYHFCTRRQDLVGFPDMANLPAVRQLWIWQNGIVADELVVRSSANLHSIILSTSSDYGAGATNQIRRLDLAGQNWGALNGPVRIVAVGIGLEEVDFTGMSGLGRIELNDNNLDTVTVDHILTVVDSWNSSNGTLYLAGNEAPTPAVGVVAADNLRARGWTVTHRTPRVLLWSDEFDRPDAVGFANSGGWYSSSLWSDTDVAISNEKLVLSGPNNYRVFLHDAGGSLPANIEVEIGFTVTGPTEPGTWWGVVNRWGEGGTQDGCRVLFADNDTLRIGRAQSPSDGTNTDITLPAGWDTPGQHTVSLRSVGSQHDVFYDGTWVASRAFSYYNSFAGGAVGFCGQPQGRAWDYIRVYSA